MVTKLSVHNFVKRKHGMSLINEIVIRHKQLTYSSKSATRSRTAEITYKD